MGAGPALNGGYYGRPSGTPLPPPATHSIPRRRGGGCCCCVVGLFLKIVISLVLVVGVAALVVWLVLRPTKPRFYVQSASVSNFNVSEGTLHQIGMQMNIRARNANKRMGISYHSVQASAYYGGLQLAPSSTLPDFYQPHKSTTILQATLVGESVLLPTDVSDQLSSAQKSGALVDIQLRLHSRIRFKVGRFKSRHYAIKVKCSPLSLGVGLNQTTTFDPRKCRVDF